MILDKTKERFFNKINKTGTCWVWLASKKSDGYGNFYSNLKGVNKNISAPRFSWIFHFGSIQKDICVLHKCDNPSCVNPEHLFLGTHTDNMRDKMKKGRHKSTKSSSKYCKRGHEFTIKNTYLTKDDGRHCKKCRADRERARRNRIKNEKQMF